MHHRSQICSYRIHDEAPNLNILRPCGCALKKQCSTTRCIFKTENFHLTFNQSIYGSSKSNLFISYSRQSSNFNILQPCVCALKAIFHDEMYFRNREVITNFQSINLWIGGPKTCKKAFGLATLKFMFSVG